MLTVLVFIHEMGHFMVARWNGIAVQTFSIGFGKELWGFTDRKGTRWRLSAIPLGGYVRFLGDMNAASVPDYEAIEGVPPEQRKSLFVNKNVWQRISVVAAGPVVNIVFAFLVIYGFLVGFGRYDIPAIVGATVAPPAVVEQGAEPPVTVAYDAGILAGDRVVSIDGFEVRGFNDISRLIQTAPDRMVTIVVERGGELLTFVVRTGSAEREDRFGNTIRVGVLGIMSQEDAEYELFRPNPIDAIGITFEEMRFIIDRTVGFIANFRFTPADVQQLSGPVEIARSAGQIATLGVPALVIFAGFVSLSLGIFNLLPVPMLDGGHILYYLIEAIRRKPLSQRVQEFGFRIGVAVIFTLLLTITVFNTIPTFLKYLGVV